VPTHIDVLLFSNINLLRGEIVYLCEREVMKKKAIAQKMGRQIDFDCKSAFEQ